MHFGTTVAASSLVHKPFVNQFKIGISPFPACKFAGRSYLAGSHSPICKVAIKAIDRWHDLDNLSPNQFRVLDVKAKRNTLIFHMLSRHTANPQITACWVNSNGGYYWQKTDLEKLSVYLTEERSDKMTNFFSGYFSLHSTKVMNINYFDLLEFKKETSERFDPEAEIEFNIIHPAQEMKELVESEPPHIRTIQKPKSFEVIASMKFADLMSLNENSQLKIQRSISASSDAFYHISVK
jgi:hypothetical protein